MATKRQTPSEMAFFVTLVRCGSFAAAAREIGVTTPAVSKRLAQIEARLGVQLLVKAYPEVDVQLALSVDPPALADEAFDVCIRFGEPPDARVIARRIAANRRLLCASPVYLARCGQPRVPSELARHNCICIRQGDEAFGVWRFSSGRSAHTVKVRGNLSTSDGEIAVNWALDGHGIVMRAEWDVARYLRSGRLREVLDTYRTPPADIYAVYPQRHQGSARVRAFVDFVAVRFAAMSPGGQGQRIRW